MGGSRRGLVNNQPTGFAEGMPAVLGAKLMPLHVTPGCRSVSIPGTKEEARATVRASLSQPGTW